MMGRKQRLKNGVEYDLLSEVSYLYLQNHNKEKRFYKRAMNKRMRQESKQDTGLRLNLIA